MITFTAKTKELQKAFKQLKVGLGVLNKKTKGFACEITVTDGLVRFNIPGFENSLPCATSGTVKVSMSFLRLYDIIIHEHKKEMHFEIGDGEMKMGVLIVPVLTCVFKDDSILRSIRMPINFKEIDLLRLEKQGYTFEEIQFNKLLYAVMKAEENYKKNLSAAFNILKDYGVTREELESIVKEKIDAVIT
jgi:hypothetical protein